MYTENVSMWLYIYEQKTRINVQKINQGVIKLGNT